jgi:flagellar FliL protein
VVTIIIISDSPKTEHIVRFLQTAIKVKIDVVTDIDQALQDIFVKRPTVVCIQNRISDINADDIARHIKMLLRNDVPSFILMHEGDGSAKPVTGLFEHLLDLTLPETKLEETLGAALESILGTQWEHVRLPSPPQENKQLETTGTTPKSLQESPGAEEHDAFVLVNSLDEFMTSMPEIWERELVNSAHPDNAPTASAANLPETTDDAPRKSVPYRQSSVECEKPVKKVTQEPLPPEVPEAPSETSALRSPSSMRPAPPPRPAPPLPAAGAAQQDNHPARKPAVSTPSTVPAPGDFRFTTTAAAATVQEQNEIAPFIKNFELPDRKWKRRAGIALAIVACTAAWYLLRQKPVALTAVPLPTPVPTAVHKAISSVRPPLENAAAPSPELPAFVPAAGRDSAYATRHPGWERYAGTGYECRIFRENNRIKAVQVLSVERQNLDEELFKKALAELSGNDHYQVISREHDGDYLIVRGSVAGKADLVLYTRKSKLHAFVVSLN